jgi:predicted O-methyltransferase YrrM
MTAARPTSESGGRPVVNAVQVAITSSRALIRQARGRYTTDVLTWPFRREFASVWRTVDWIPGWFNEGSAALLYSLMRDQPPTTVVEIGSYLGRSTVFFALSLRRLRPDGRVVAIDPHTGDRQQLEGLHADRLPSFELFQQHCRVAQVDDIVTAQVTTSTEAAAGWSGPIDVLYVDGWHSYAAVVADGRAWLPHLSPDGVVVFDDFVAYDEVRAAVEQLAAEGLFHLWGAVFGQAIGGSRREPPPAVRRALLLSRGGIARSLRARLSG